MITLSPGDVLVLLSCLGAIAGVIYAAGRLSARVDALEEWRRNMAGELSQIYGAIRRVESLVKGEET